MEGELISVLKDYKVKQISTHKISGKVHTDFVSLAPLETYTFADITASGEIINIWLTATPSLRLDKDNKIPEFGTPKDLTALSRFTKYHYLPDLLQGVFLKISFDNKKTPSVYTPIGVFFGSGFGEYKHFISRFVGMTAGGFVCYFPMPFRKKAKIEVENTLEDRGFPRLYMSLEYVEYGSEADLKDRGYFHAKHNKKQVDTGYSYEIVRTDKGKGHFSGLVLNSRTNRKFGLLNMEGDLEMFINGEENASIVYTGTEDAFQGGWYYTKGARAETEFYTPYHGLTVKSFNKLGSLGQYVLSRLTGFKTSQYRFFPKGIPFDSSFKCLLHTGESDEVRGEYESVAYWYQKNP